MCTCNDGLILDMGNPTVVEQVMSLAMASMTLDTGFVTELRASAA